MDLMEFFKKGNLGNLTINSEVTATGHEIQGGNLGNLGNHEINSNQVKFKTRAIRAVIQKTTKPDNQTNVTKPLKIAEIAETATHPVVKTNVACGQCLHFKCHNAHGKGAGYCLIGGDYGLWSETQHQCIKFDAMVVRVELPDPKPNAIMVKCYTPNGNLIEVEARDPQHAEWLRQSNPPQGILK